MLLYLVENPDRVIGKDELLAAIWPGRIVEESNLSQNIFTLRKALSGPGEQDRFIVTSPGRGYRFTAPLQRIPRLSDQLRQDARDMRSSPAVSSANVAEAADRAQEQPLPKRQTQTFLLLLAGAVVPIAIAFFVLASGHPLFLGNASRVSAEKSIAVLPLLNTSDDPDNEYFSDGLSEELISVLARSPDLKVISRGSSFQFKGKTDDSRTIGDKLGVAYLLEGSVRKSFERVRIDVALVRSTDGVSIWAESYDRDLQDLFAVQSEIAGAIAGQLKLELLGNANNAATPLPSEPSNENLAAYNALLQGNFYFERSTQENLRKAIGFYEDAVRLDPRYAVGYAKLSQAWETLAAEYLGGSDLEDGMARARSAANTALVLDPDLALAHYTLGRVLLDANFDWAHAETELRRALDLAPNDTWAQSGLADLMGALGRIEEHLALMRQALVLDPLHHNWYNQIGVDLADFGHYDEAEQSIQKGIELQPGAAYLHATLALVDVMGGRLDKALTAAQSEPDPFWRRYALALTWAARGDRHAADAALDEMQAKDAGIAAFQIANLYALRKEPDQAFVWLDRAYAQHDAGIRLLLESPLLLAYKTDPRFAAFCRKVGLPSPTPASQGGRVQGLVPNCIN